MTPTPHIPPEVEVGNEKTPEGADSYSLRLNTDSITHVIRQLLLDLLTDYQSSEKPMSEELLKMYIEGVEVKLLALFTEHSAERERLGRLREAGEWLQMVVRYDSSKFDSNQWYKLNPQDVMKFYAHRLSQLSTTNKEKECTS